MILMPFPGSFSRVFGWLRDQCAGAWILHVEDDEVPAIELAAEIAETVERSDVTHAWVRRRWLYPDRHRYLDQWPWRPDYSLRLFRNEPGLLRFPGRVHDLIQALGPRRFLRAPIYHGRLLLSTMEERERKIRVAYRWADRAEEEGLRTAFGAAMAPGERVLVPVEVLGPQALGEHTLELDLVHEHVRWFGAGIRVTLAVESPATDGEGTMSACSVRPSRTSSRS